MHKAPPTPFRDPAWAFMGCGCPPETELMQPWGGTAFAWRRASP